MSREDKAILKKSLKLVDLQLDVEECEALRAMLKCIVAQGGKLVGGDPFPELEKKAEKARKRLARYEKTVIFKKSLTKGS